MPHTARQRVLTGLGAAAVVSALVAAVSHSLTSPAPAYPAEDFSEDAEHPVTRIMAGATIELDIGGTRETIPLVGVDDQGVLPRVASAGRGAEHSARLTHDLLLGEAVYLRRVSTPARVDGHLPAYVYRAPDGLFVNLELIRQGYAAAAGPPHVHSRLFSAYDKRARAAAKGMWAPRADAVTAARAMAPGEQVSRPPVQRPRPQASAVTVYITRTGKKYHADGCRSLSRSKIPSSLAEARKTLTPCSVCDPPQ